MECILCSIERFESHWAEVENHSTRNSYVPIWINHRLCCSCSKVQVSSQKRGVYEATAKGCWPKSCWQLNGYQVQVRGRETCPSGFSEPSSILQSTTFRWLQKQVTNKTTHSLRITVIVQAYGKWQQYPFSPVVLVWRISSRSQRNTQIPHGLQEFKGRFLVPGPAGLSPPEHSSTVGICSEGPWPGLLRAECSCGAAKRGFTIL